MKRVLFNNVGYDSLCSKKAIFQSTEPVDVRRFALIEEQSGEEVFSGVPVKSGPVARWNKGDYYVCDFSVFAPDADKNYGPYYFIRVETAEGNVDSGTFQIYGSVIEYSTVSSVVYYLKSQRATGEWEVADRDLPFRAPRQGSQDVHGGWFDATGDVGVHLTLLSHASFFNPQQACMPAHVLYRMLDFLPKNSSPWYNQLQRRILDEASYGADWLMRLRAPSGTFFKTGPTRTDAYEATEAMRTIYYELNDDFSLDATVDITGNKPVTDEMYEASFRAGGGYAIAALAAAARYPYPSCEHTGYEYLNAARESYLYLEANNERYTSDGKNNLVDEFCALSAAIEIYKSSGQVGFLIRARNLVEKIEDRYREVSECMGYLAVNDGDRPYFSATDEGTPIVALMTYLEIEKEPTRRAAVLALCEKVMRFALSNTDEVANPFGYARLYYELPTGERGTQFFFPHETEEAPWWQGDNARILSLSTAARMVARETEDAELARRLNVYADDQIDWVLGINPFDTCMIEGVGHHNIDYFFKYQYDFIGAPGGIVNGITSGLHDEEGIAFIMSPDDDPEIDDNWRWAEQWLPHAAWYLYALAVKRI